MERPSLGIYVNFPRARLDECDNWNNGITIEKLSKRKETKEDVGGGRYQTRQSGKCTAGIGMKVM